MAINREDFLRKVKGPLDLTRIREVVAKMDEAAELAFMEEIIKKRVRRLEEKGRV